MILAILVLAVITTWLLWPLDSNIHQIEFNQDKIAFKNRFLTTQKVNLREGQARPNIIIIYADDLGKTDISLYGSPHVETPWMDSLGINGATFQEGYVTASICSPSRASLLTGRYQQRFGYEYQPQNQYLANRLQYYAVKYFIDTDFWVLNERMSSPTREDMEKQGLPPSEITLASLLKKQGYKTGIFGKWHLGNFAPFHPNRNGFDEFYGFMEAFSLFADTSAADIINHHHSDFSDPHIWGHGREGSCAIRRNDEIVEEDEYLTFAIAREANAFLEKNRNEPFLMYLPFNAPHTPFQVPKKYFDQFSQVEDRNKRVYYGMIKALDDAIGQIIRKVRELGLEENTLICFASDNGGASYTYATDNAPLKGGKISNFEGGVNVPMMMYWKGVIPAGTEINHPVTVMDFFGTAVAISGAELPQDRVYDGVNLLPFLQNDSLDKSPHEAIYWKTAYNKSIRKGPWKLIINEFQKDTLLYNLEEDKIEHINQAAFHPEVIEKLIKVHTDWEKDLSPALWPRVMDFEIEIRDTLYRYAM